MKKFYFRLEDSEMCHTIEYFHRKMKQSGIKEMTVFEAEKEKIEGIFWCKEHQFHGESSEHTCGKECEDYAPRNSKSGCCKHYTTTLYTDGEQIILTL